MKNKIKILIILIVIFVSMIFVTNYKEYKIIKLVDENKEIYDFVKTQVKDLYNVNMDLTTIKGIKKYKKEKNYSENISNINQVRNPQVEESDAAGLFYYGDYLDITNEIIRLLN